MNDRTFRLILDGKKGGLVKGSTPASAAKKAYKKLSADLGKTSFKFELQETTKDSKKKVYGPYKANLVKDKIKVKMVGGNFEERSTPFNSFINENNKEYKDILLISKVAKNWENLERILKYNNKYSDQKKLELKKLGINKNNPTFFEINKISNLYEYYKKHKEEFKN